MASSADCRATLDCIRKLGIEVEEAGSELVIGGRGLFGYRPSRHLPHLDAANSGSTIRMLSGLLAGQGFISEIDGDASLRRRPMGRIIEPLGLMGARVEGTRGSFAPLTIRGTKLRAINYASPVASAQVKTCVLFAGLLAEGRTTFSEPAPSRNHTELMLKHFGVPIEVEPSGAVNIEGLRELKPAAYQVPGDLSSAAFFIAAATILEDSELLIRGVGLNPTRMAFIEVLNSLGAAITKRNVREQHSEVLGDLVVASRRLGTERRGAVLSGATIANIIDEIPILAVVATQVEGRVEVRDARELRVKESDRIRTIADCIRGLGGKIDEFQDGFAIEGPQHLVGGTVKTAGDHRIAMALTIAGLIARGRTEIVDADCASVSFPEFYDSLAKLTPPDTVTPNECS
jgi:3-phosphoshikimate 1-carboxyvinyltransferase